jgi:hypothetical protein
MSSKLSAPEPKAAKAGITTAVVFSHSRRVNGFASDSTILGDLTKIALANFQNDHPSIEGNAKNGRKIRPQINTKA